MPANITKLTPVLIVDAIEPCIPFWTERLGFEQTAAVPEGDRLGFVILAKGAIEVMYQTKESIAKDTPGAVEEIRGHSVGIFLEVDDIEAVVKRLAGLPPIVPRRRTFYGTDEIGVREPAGHLVLFAQHVSG
jgi:uncharacterized glyoxalase superfamily protein PhnB